MERLDVTATRALQSLLGQQPTSAAKVHFAWSIVAGPALTRAATVTWSEDGTLIVRAKSEAWRKEIVRNRPMLAARIGHLLGAGVVRSITVTGGF